MLLFVLSNKKRNKKQETRRAHIRKIHNQKQRALACSVRGSVSRRIRLWGYQMAVLSLNSDMAPLRTHLKKETRHLVLLPSCDLLDTSSRFYGISIRGLAAWFHVGGSYWASTPVLLPVELAGSAGIATRRPLIEAVRLMSSSSMLSRVEVVSASTSAAVRPLVGIGSRTRSGC